MPQDEQDDDTDHGNARSLDEFLEEACQFSTVQRQWRYWLLFLSLGVANSSDAAEILCISYILSDDSFTEHILQHQEWKGGLLAATVFAGMLMGGLLVGGSWGDVLGRRPTLLIGLATNSIAGLLSACAWDAYSLSALRFVAGIGIGGTVPPLFTLCSELASPRNRGLCVTIAASFWMVGSIYVALTAWYWFGFVGNSSAQSQWRIFAATCAMPSAVGWLLVWTQVPESPRFLLLQGSHHRAVDVVQQLSDRLSYYGSAWRLGEARTHATAREKRNSYPETGIVSNAIGDFVHSAKQLYVPELQRVTWPLQLVWFSLSFGSYGLYTWINTIFKAVHLENVYYNALLFALSNLPGNILSATLMDRVGRAKLLIGSILLAALSLLSFAYFGVKDNPQETEHGEDELPISQRGIVLSACSFQMFTIISWNAIDVLTSELFPTTVRATGMGLCAASGRVGAMLAQFVNGALASHPAALLVVAAATLICGATTPTMLPADRTGQPVSDFVTPDAQVNGHLLKNGADPTSRTYQHNATIV